MHPRRHRRRLHRRHRRGQHAGARRHAHGAGHRRAGEGRCRAEADAVVVALKSRTTPAARGGGANRWPRCAGCSAAGARQFYFKYCSTFDSTPAGNIGPVAEALMDALRRRLHDRLPGVPRERPHGLPRPPVRRRPAAVRLGHAPPSADADDRRQPRARAAGAVARPGRAACATTPSRAGADAVRARFDALRAEGVRLAVADAIADDDLRALGRGAAPSCR